MIRKYLFYTMLCTVGLWTCANAQEMKPEETEVWEPVPPKVTPGVASMAPSDAIVLFDGTDWDHWESMEAGQAVQWTIQEGYATVKPKTGGIRTKQGFGSCQLHIEWKTPVDTTGLVSQQRGNSGVFLMSKYEVQVLDNYRNRTYSNGQAGSIYKQHIPLVNACKPPGEWQAYDIIFTAPSFKADGSVETPAYVTVIHNGVLIQNHVELKGPSVYIGLPSYEAHADQLPIILQDHGNYVSYRNIWIREL